MTKIEKVVHDHALSDPYNVTVSTLTFDLLVMADSVTELSFSLTGSSNTST